MPSIVGEHGQGASMPWSRFAYLMLAASLMLGIAAYLSTIYTPQTIVAVLAIFSPLWRLLGSIASKLLIGLAILLEPIMNWLIETLRAMLEGTSLFEPQEAQPPPEYALPDPQETASFSELVQNVAIVRYCFVAAILCIVGAALWFLLIKPYIRAIQEEDEETEIDPLALDGNPFRYGLDRLRALADLLRTYGLSSQLLDAVSVENVYANLSRLARRRGFPRRLDQSPDLYLPDLRAAFPNQNEAVARITNAYMRVHYGDRTVSVNELAQIRSDYKRIVDSLEER